MQRLISLTQQTLHKHSSHTVGRLRPLALQCLLFMNIQVNFVLSVLTRLASDSKEPLYHSGLQQHTHIYSLLLALHAISVTGSITRESDLLLTVLASTTAGRVTGPRPPDARPRMSSTVFASTLATTKNPAEQTGKR